MDPHNSVVFDADLLSVSLGIDDPGVSIDIYSEYLRNLEELCTVLERHAASPKTLYVEVHKIKSSSALVGARQLAAKLGELEHLLLRPGEPPSEACIADTRMLCRQTYDVVHNHIVRLQQA